MNRFHTGTWRALGDEIAVCDQEGTARSRGVYERRGRPEDRGFLDRAGDKLRSWFGDEEAERRRREDEREARRRGWLPGRWATRPW